MTFERLQPKDVEIYAFENPGRSRSAGRIGGMVHYAQGSPLTVTGYTNTVMTLGTDTTYQATKTLSSCADAGNGRTRFLTSDSHDYVAGDVVVIASAGAYNGTYVIYNVSDNTHFDIDIAYTATTTGTSAKVIASYKGDEIGVNDLVGCWALIRGSAASNLGWTMYQITANDALNGASKTITVNNTVTGPGLLASDTTGYDADGTDDIFIYITEYPILGIQTNIGTDYGPFFLKSISTVTITEGFASGVNMTADSFNDKYLCFLSGKYRGKIYEILDTTTTTIVLDSSITDASGIGALTWRDNVFFRIMDKEQLTAGVAFDLPLKSEVGAGKSSTGTTKVNGGQVMIDGTMEMKSYEEKWMYAAIGGYMKDTSNNFHMLEADMDNYTPNATSGTYYTQDGYDVKYFANRTPSGRDDSIEGWPLNHCAPPDLPHICFIRYKYKDRANSKYIKTIYEDVMLSSDGQDAISVTSDDALTQKFKLTAVAKDCYNINVQ